MRRALAIIAAALTTSCTSLAPGPHEADRYFILEAPASQTSHSTSALTILPTSAASFYDTQDIVYSRAAGTRAYYQYSHWTDRPQRAIHAQLVSRLGAAGSPGRFALATHLDEIYHDAAQSPGAARLTITAQLIDPADRRVLARRSFSSTVPVTSYDADGAVAGLRQALGAVLKELETWVTANLPPRPG